MSKYNTELGHRYGKPDIERIGLFAEMDYMNGKGYVSLYANMLRKEPTKGRQLFPGGSKSKCGSQDGYFREEYKRIFEKEAYSEPYRMMLQFQVESAKKNVSKSAFVIPGSSKKHSCPGDYHGTFSGKVDGGICIFKSEIKPGLHDQIPKMVIKLDNAFSPELRKMPPYKKEKPNILINSGKKGGPGYADITISKYPEHSEDYYDAGKENVLKAYEAYKKAIKSGPLYSSHYTKAYFDHNPYFEEKPGKTYLPQKEKKYLKDKGTKWYPPSPPKKIGGCKSGCFEKWPEHSTDKYITEAKLMRSKAPIFYPPARSKTMQTSSIIFKKVDIALNSKNWRNFQPVTFPNQ